MTSRRAPYQPPDTIVSVDELARYIRAQPWERRPGHPRDAVSQILKVVNSSDLDDEFKAEIDARVKEVRRDVNTHSRRTGSVYVVDTRLVDIYGDAVDALLERNPPPEGISKAEYAAHVYRVVHPPHRKKAFGSSPHGDYTGNDPGILGISRNGVVIYNDGSILSASHQVMNPRSKSALNAIRQLSQEKHIDGDNKEKIRTMMHAVMGGFEGDESRDRILGDIEKQPPFIRELVNRFTPPSKRQIKSTDQLVKNATRALNREGITPTGWQILRNLDEESSNKILKRYDDKLPTEQVKDTVDIFLKNQILSPTPEQVDTVLHAKSILSPSLRSPEHRAIRNDVIALMLSEEVDRLSPRDVGALNEYLRSSYESADVSDWDNLIMNAREHDRLAKEEYERKWKQRQLEREEAKRIHNAQINRALREAGVTNPDGDHIGVAELFINEKRWSYDLSKSMIKLAIDDDRVGVNSADRHDIFSYMDTLESSGKTSPNASTWDELIDEIRDLKTYRTGAGFGGDFPPIRTISSFDDIPPEELSQRDPIDLSDLPRYQDVTGRRPIENIDDMELPTVTGGSGLTPDLDDLRSEIDRFKEDKPRINREEYRGGTGRDPGYRQRRGRGRMT